MRQRNKVESKTKEILESIISLLDDIVIKLGYSVSAVSLDVDRDGYGGSITNINVETSSHYIDPLETDLYKIKEALKGL